MHHQFLAGRRHFLGVGNAVDIEYIARFQIFGLKTKRSFLDGFLRSRRLVLCDQAPGRLPSGQSQFPKPGLDVQGLNCVGRSVGLRGAHR